MTTLSGLRTYQIQIPILKSDLRTHKTDVFKFADVDIELECDLIGLFKQLDGWVARYCLNFERDIDVEEGADKFTEVEEVSSGRGEGENCRW